MIKFLYSSLALLPLLTACKKDAPTLGSPKPPVDIEIRLTQVGTTPYVNKASFTKYHANDPSGQDPKAVYWKGSFAPDTQTMKTTVGGWSGYLNVFYTKGRHATYRLGPNDYIEAEVFVNGQSRSRARIDAATFATTPCYYTDSTGSHLFDSVPLYF